MSISGLVLVSDWKTFAMEKKVSRFLAAPEKMPMKPHIIELRRRYRGRRCTRKEMRRAFYLRTAKTIPEDVNLRVYFAEWHAQQQAINGGDAPSRFWKRVVDLHQ